MILVALAILALGGWFLWQLIPDPDAARPGDIKESDLLPLTKRTTPSHVSDVWAGMAEVEADAPIMADLAAQTWEGLSVGEQDEEPYYETKWAPSYRG